LLGRLVTIPYYPLTTETLGFIVRLQMERIRKRIARQHGIPFNYDDAAVELVIQRCTEIDSGGRMIDAILTNTVLPTLSREYLTRLAEGRPLTSIGLSAVDADFRYDFDGAATSESTP
jgi:type VI secretion system protein VasG